MSFGPFVVVVDFFVDCLSWYVVGQKVANHQLSSLKGV